MTTFSQLPGGGTIPTDYVPGPSPLSAEGYPVYVRAELNEVARAIESILVLLPQAAVKAPVRPVENMIRYAKAPWRPLGGTTDRMVMYAAGSWVALSST